MKVYQTSKIHGFTLVELAIVITIIGILIGGVLKGQQLIDQARFAATIQQLHGYQTAVRIFQTKYDSLPGDFPYAESRIIDCAGCNADGSNPLGDGYVGKPGDVRSPQSDKGLEPVMFWLQLYKAGMINGVSDAALTAEPVAWGSTHPATKLGGGFHAKSGLGDDDNAWGGGKEPKGLTIIMLDRVDGAPWNSGGGSYGGHVLTPYQAAQIDRKMDDGIGSSGSIRVHGFRSYCYPYQETLESQHCGIGYIVQ